MGQQYLGEIRIMGFNFPPKYWAFCNGQLMSIQQNNALFSLLGTYYGGNGIQSFALPNLQGSAPIHMGANYTIGQNGGEFEHTLAISEMPVHNHSVNARNIPADTQATGAIPSPSVVLAQGLTHDPNTPTPVSLYASPTVNTGAAFSAQAISLTGNNAPHNNMQPYTVIPFCIALSGIFPSRG